MDKGYGLTHCGRKKKANKDENTYKQIIQKMKIKTMNFFQLIKLAKHHRRDNTQCG